MTFDIHQDYYDDEGFFLEDEVQAFQNELIERFVNSAEGQSIISDAESDWADLFLDIVIRRLGVQLHYIYTADIREILYYIIPAHVVIQPRDVPSLIAELKAFFQFLKREFSLRNADACLKVLNQKNIVKKMTEELGNPDNFGPSKMILMQMLDAGVDITDEAEVKKYIENYNAQIAESMKPPPVTEKAQTQYKVVKKLIKGVCAKHLNKEYYDMSMKLLDKFLFMYSDKLERGQAKSWAAAIVYTIGRVNFLFDPSQIPHLSAKELCDKFDVSQGNASQKSTDLFRLFDMMQFDPEWTLASKLDDNPLIWMVMIDGLLHDIRSMPREVQVMAYNQGIIPYIPADRA